MDRARYVILGEVISGTASTTRKPGAARIALRVTEKASNKVVCRGVSEAVIKPDHYVITGSSADFDFLYQLKNAAVFPVCAAGGPKLCKSMYRITLPEPPASEPAASEPAAPAPPESESTASAPAPASPPPASHPVKKRSRRH
jgi:hypothetical protein